MSRCCTRTGGATAGSARGAGSEGAVGSCYQMAEGLPVEGGPDALPDGDGSGGLGTPGGLLRFHADALPAPRPPPPVLLRACEARGAAATAGAGRLLDGSQ